MYTERRRKQLKKEGVNVELVEETAKNFVENKKSSPREVHTVEYSKIFRHENGVEVELRVKAECSTKEEMQKTLSFIAQSSHQFYLETAGIINSKL